MAASETVTLNTGKLEVRFSANSKPESHASGLSSGVHGLAKVD